MDMLREVGSGIGKGDTWPKHMGQCPEENAGTGRLGKLPVLVTTVAKQILFHWGRMVSICGSGIALPLPLPPGSQLSPIRACFFHLTSSSWSPTRLLFLTCSAHLPWLRRSQSSMGKLLT